MGWEDRPQALGEVCRWVAGRWPTPIIVTENGYPGDDDTRRAAFITAAVGGLAAAIAEGADVRGYFYWSLLDNFEWLFGFPSASARGAVDRATQRRTIKSSAETLAAIARARACRFKPKPKRACLGPPTEGVGMRRIERFTTKRTKATKDAMRSRQRFRAKAPNSHFVLFVLFVRFVFHVLPSAPIC